MRDILQDLDDGGEERDALSKAREHARTKLPKKFYEVVELRELDDSFGVFLDGQAVKTPARRDLKLVNTALGQLVADEFTIQVDVIDPSKMPITRLVNTVVDGMIDDMQPVKEDLLRFVASDMLFYRADSPKELVERQNKQWDPIIDWAATRFGARFILGEGVMHVEQPREAIGALGAHIQQITSPFRLAAIHTMASLTGSGLLALALADGTISVHDAWKIAHLDEDWTIEHWGEDEEAMARRRYREAEMIAAAAVLEAVS